MRIGINALQVRAAKSGVGHYIDALLDGLLEVIGPDDQIVVYATPQNASNYDRGDPRVRTRRWGPGGRRPVRLLHEWIFLPRQLQRDRIDVFHGANNFLPRRCHCPTVVTLHDVSYFIHPERTRWLRRRYWHWMTRRSAAMADGILTDSEAAKADILRHLGVAAGRVEVVRLAAHPRFCPLADAAGVRPLLEKYRIDGPYILHVGTLEPGKNIPRLIEAFALFRKRSSLDWRLALIGDRGWLYEDLFKRIEDFALKDRVIVAGHVPDDELPLLYNAAEFFVFPSLNEGFGLPPLEALACGTAVMASNASSLPEILGDAALYVDPLSVGSIAETMLRLARDEALRTGMGARGPAQARRYSWVETARRTHAAYRRVIDTRNPGIGSMRA